MRISNGTAYQLLEYLCRNATRQGKSTEDILRYLLEFTPWGRGKLSESEGDLGAAERKELRNVQNFLKRLADDQYIKEFLFREPSGLGNGLIYRVDATRVSQPLMDIEEALTLLLAERFLQHALPAEFHERRLNTLFRTARERLNNQDVDPAQSRTAVNLFIKRIAICQRGQQLVTRPSQVPLSVIGVLSQAILERKQLCCTFSDGKKNLHPYGIIIREPKVYLLAAEDHLLRKCDPENVEPRQYLCSRIEQASIVNISNRVPDEFDAMAYVARGKLDVVHIGPTDSVYTLILRVITGSDNLIADLTTYPLSQQQTLEQDANSPDFILRAPGMRLTYQLVEWIIARMDRIEVISPDLLRSHMRKKISAMHRIYVADDQD